MHRLLVSAALLFTPLSTPSAHTTAGARATAPDAVQFKTGDGQTLSASFYKPASRSPGVILVHDAGADHSQLDAVADRLSKQGFGVLTLDLRGHGANKSGALDWSKLSDGDKQTTWSYAQRDLDAAADWLGTQPNIHTTSLALVAYGAGCALAVRHAKNDENVVCMVLLAPKPKDYGFDVKADIETLAGLPTCVVAAKDDPADKMAKEANASSGSPFVETFYYTPPKVTSPLEDKALPNRMSKWVAEKAMPKKGK
jgi:dienelactone hydrolase